MIRLLLRLFGIKDFDTCKSCETLKQQLEYERSEKQKLTQTLLDIIKPKTFEASPVELNPVQKSLGSFSHRKAALEAADRERARILKDRKFIGTPDDKIAEIKKNTEIEALEKELEIEQREA